MPTHMPTPGFSIVETAHSEQEEPGLDGDEGREVPWEKRGAEPGRTQAAGSPPAPMNMEGPKDSDDELDEDADEISDPRQVRLEAKEGCE